MEIPSSVQESLRFYYARPKRPNKTISIYRTILPGLDSTR